MSSKWRQGLSRYSFWKQNWTKRNLNSNQRQYFSQRPGSCQSTSDMATSSRVTLETLAFDNLVLRTLPVESNTSNYVRQVSAACFSRVQPTPLEAPVTVAFAADTMALLDLTEEELERPEFARFFSGTDVLPGAEPAAHCYCGHQFGQFAGQLGDGAAIYLGEVVNKQGERWEVQLKGAGKTPYSRQGDGRKVLRSTIREFLCSEAMYHLGIPTTRAGACITSETTVIRDIFYDGHPINEKATVVVRIAPTFLRFGSFEIFKTRDPLTGRSGSSVGRHEILSQMLNYVTSTFYPEIANKHPNDEKKKYKAFYGEIVKRTARLVAEWQCVGFCHGVLNTDNMSIVGVTIDYGPFGFMDHYNPYHICNASDEGGRYAFIKQPEICKWNLQKFAEVLVPALPLEDAMQELKGYESEYKMCYLGKMRKKMGLLNKQLDEDDVLVQQFLDTMEATGADFTNCFRGLNLLSLSTHGEHEGEKKKLLEYFLNQSCSLEEMKAALDIGMDEGQFQLYMILMNTQPEILESFGKGLLAVQRELERRKKLDKLKRLDANEKRKSDEEKWEKWLMTYIKRLKKEIENVTDIDQFNDERIRVMNRNNPRIVLRNYIAQNAIAKAENGDFSEVNRVLELLRHPFDEVKLPELLVSKMQQCSSADDDSEKSHHLDAAKKWESNSDSCSYTQRPPEWASQLRVT